MNPTIKLDTAAANRITLEKIARADAARKLLIADYVALLGDSAPTLGKKPSVIALLKCQEALLRKYGKTVPHSGIEVRKSASALFLTLRAKTSPGKLETAVQKITTARTALREKAADPVARAVVVAKAPEAMLPTDPREELAKQWAAIPDAKAKTAFYRQHQAALRGWLRDMQNKGLTLGR